MQQFVIKCYMYNKELPCIRQEGVQGAPRGGQRGRRAQRRRARLRRQGAAHPYMQRLGLRARRSVVELRLPARRPLQRGDRPPL